MRYMLMIGLLFSGFTLFAQPKTGAGQKDGGIEERHIISFTPFSGIVAYSAFNPAAGFDYDYMISKEYGISMHIPMMLGYTGPEQFGDYTHTSVYTAPGIRFHTGRSNSDIDFMTGPAILIGNIHFRPSSDIFNPTIVRSPYNYSMIGLLADNTLNFYRRHFVFGFDVRIGSMIETHEDTRFFIHFGMHFGGKF